MHTTGIARYILGFVVVKGFVMGMVASLLDVGFWRALILVLASAIVTGSFGVLIAIVQARADREIHNRLDKLEGRSRDIAGAVGATKRETDHPGNGIADPKV